MIVRQRLLGVFATAHEATAAVRALEAKGRCTVDVYSPVPDHHLLEAPRPKPNVVRYFTLAGALCGLAGGFGLAIWTALMHDLWLSGMPPVAPIPFVIVGFEVTVLLGGLCTLLGLLIGGRLPKLLWKGPWDPRLSEDHFGVGVNCIEAYEDVLARVLEEHGAVDVVRG
jgi:molybdopterin-containing oxidoreductase family membrane subunit